MESHPKWIHYLHSPEAWIALVGGGAEILIHEPLVRDALILMLALGIAFAVFLRKMRKDEDQEGDFSTLHLTASPPSAVPANSLPSRNSVVHKS